MAFINTCPHSVDVYKEENFVNLQKLNATTWVADSVEGEAIFSVPMTGKPALRIDSNSQPLGTSTEGIPLFDTVYGELTNIPEMQEGDDVITSLPVVSLAKQTGHPLLPRLCSPYKVVRLRSDTSKVLGCHGLQYQLS